MRPRSRKRMGGWIGPSVRAPCGTACAGRSLLKVWQADVLAVSGRAGEILEAGKAGITVGCGDGALRIVVLQQAGGRRLAAHEFLAGHKLESGQKFE